MRPRPRVTVIRGRGRPINALVAALVLAAAVAADYAAFRLLDLNYLRWYINQGPLIALAVAGVALAVELDRLPNLIAAHPSLYLGACLELPGESFLSFASMLEPSTQRADADRGPLDWLLAALLAIAFVVVVVAWLIVIAPLQYFGNLVAGAPARSALGSTTRTWALRRKEATVVKTTPIKEMPERAEEIGLARRPVSLTSTITAGLLFAVSQFV